MKTADYSWPPEISKSYSLRFWGITSLLRNHSPQKLGHWLSSIFFINVDAKCADTDVIWFMTILLPFESIIPSSNLNRKHKK